MINIHVSIELLELRVVKLLPIISNDDPREFEVVYNEFPNEVLDILLNYLG